MAHCGYDSEVFLAAFHQFEGSQLFFSDIRQYAFDAC
jgi:hypothetical protein